jgi:hypothetical protein
MGAWGNRNFENDQAMDFVGDFTDNPSLESLEEALSTVIEQGEEGEYIEVDEASAALAAAEILAATLAKPASDFPQELRPALTTIQVNTTLQKKARKAVKQIVKESELQELWTESGDLEEWLAVQTDLLARLN